MTRTPEKEICNTIESPTMKNEIDPQEVALGALSERSRANTERTEWVKAITEKSEQVEASAEKQKKKLEKGIKIVIGGPPHSGKSVFTGGIEAIFDEYIKDNPDSNISYYGMQASPDGEGVWLQLGYDNSEIKKLRQKGDFTPEFTDKVSEDVSDWDQTPILLVDIGGRASSQNAEIIKDATHAIIVDGGNGETNNTDAWEKFFKNNELEVIAKINSDLDEGDDETRENDEGQIIGSVHHLERGEDVGQRSTISAVAEKIIDLAKQNKPFWDAQEHRRQSAVQLTDFLKDDALMSGPNERLAYKPEAVKYIYDNIDSLSSDKPLAFTGSAPKWLYAALACAATESNMGDISMYSRRFYKPHKLSVAENGRGAEWKTEQKGYMNGCPIVMLRETSIGQSGRQIKQEDLEHMVLPELPENCIVCFSAQGPNWLSASVVLSYMNKVHAFAEWQPASKYDKRSGSIICWSKDKDDLGLRVEDSVT